MRRTSLLLAFCLAFAGRAAAQTISTFAGGGPNNLPATSANLNFPSGVARDSAGNLYIAAKQGYRVFKVATDGVLTVVAGSGVYGNSGDGGLATSASFSGPAGVAVDASGNIYIADAGPDGNVVRKVTASTGIITTVAGNGTQGYSGDGGPATGAQLNVPDAVAVDASGNIYIADSNNSAIRKVTVGTGIITTVAGNGTQGYSGDGGPATSANLRYPHGVAVDASGNIYIGDTANSRVRKVDASTGIITTVAGNGSIGCSGDAGTATEATLADPYGIAVDASGKIYIVDIDCMSVRMVDASGNITTVAGNGSIGYSGDGGQATNAELTGPQDVALGPAGSFYIADTNNLRIRMVDASGVISTVAGNGYTSLGGDGFSATKASLSGPGGVAMDTSGNVYIADSNNNVIRKVDASTGIIATVAGNGKDDYSGDGGSATAAALYSPYGVVVDANGDIYIADTNNNVIRKVSAATGVITTVAGTGTADYTGDGGLATDATLNYPFGVAVDGNGNLYIADIGNSAIRKVAASTGIITTMAGNGTPGYTGDGGLATDATLYFPTGVAVDSNGNLYIADGGNSVIRKVTASTGIITTVAGNGTPGYTGDGGLATSATLAFPSGVMVDASVNIYIADTYNNAIRKVAASTGIITTVAGNGELGYGGDGGPAIDAMLASPEGVAADGDGSLYIADSSNNVIRKVNAVPATLQSISVSPANPSLPNGETVQFHATATYSDSSTQDITGSVTWNSSKPRFATIATDGEATALKPGTTTIGASSGGVTGSTTLTITSPTLMSLSVTPTDAQITVGGRQQFAATGNYSDKTTKTITTSVTWSSSETSVATIGIGGLATGVAAGNTTIEASIGDISNTATLSVQPALVSITLYPLNPSIAVGSTVQFAATGTYSDSSTQDLTNKVAWTTTKPGVATVGASGLATGIAPGKTSIRAKLGGVSASTQLTVTR